MNAASVLRRVTARFDPGWLLALLVTGYVILATDTWHVSTPYGPPLLPSWEPLVGFTCGLGLSWRWTLAALLWPPFMQGLYVGNVMVPLVALFAAAPFARRAAGLAVAPVFKIYSAITTLWLIREGRLLELAVGGAFVVFVALATLPMVGVGLWSDWLKGLGLYRESQPVLPNSLYGIGLPHYAPESLWLLVATVVVVLALMACGREGLTRLGLATVIASPSLYAHGFVLATPAYLS